MYVVCVDFKIKAEHATRFLELVINQAQQSLSMEPDCIQFVVCRNPDDPTVLFLYERYVSADAFSQSHLKSDHFIAFDHATRDLVESKNVRSFHEVFA